MFGSAGVEFGGMDRITVFLEGLKVEATHSGGDALADQFLDELKVVRYSMGVFCDDTVNRETDFNY